MASSTGHTEGTVVAPHLPRVQAEELAGRLETSEPGLVVVDVRDATEFAGGHIKGAVNVPSTVFETAGNAELDDIIKARLADAQEVVVHCQRSQVRGPTAAAALEARLKELGLSGEPGAGGPKVTVLQGGAGHFLQAYQGSALVVDDQSAK